MYFNKWIRYQIPIGTSRDHHYTYLHTTILIILHCCCRPHVKFLYNINMCNMKNEKNRNKKSRDLILFFAPGNTNGSLVLNHNGKIIQTPRSTSVIMPLKYGSLPPSWENSTLMHFFPTSDNYIVGWNVRVHIQAINVLIIQARDFNLYLKESIFLCSYFEKNASALTRKYTNVIMLVVCHQRKRIWVGTANVWKKQ